MSLQDELKLHFDARIAVVNVVSTEEASLYENAQRHQEYKLPASTCRAGPGFAGMTR